MTTIARTAVLAALFTGAILAQPPFGGAPPDPASMIQHRVERLTALLGLTTAQASQATTIFTDAQTAITPLQTTLSGYRTSMTTAVQSNATATIDQLATSIGTTLGQITALQSKADAAFYAILTSDQQAKYKVLGGGGFGPTHGRFGPGQ